MFKIISLILFISYLLITPIALAVEAPESTQSGISNEMIKQKLKERLNQSESNTFLSANQSESGPTKWYSLFGTVTEATNASMLIEMVDKTQAKVNLDKNTKLSLFQKGKPTKSIKLEDVKPSWFAIAIGTERINSTALRAKKVTLTPEFSDSVERHVVIGKINEIDETTLMLQNGKSTSIIIPSKFDNVKMKGIKNALMEQVGLNDKAIAVVETGWTKDAKTKETKEALTLKALYVIPSISNAKSADKLVLPASASATPATPAASLLPTSRTLNTSSPAPSSSPKATTKPSTTPTPRP